MTLVSPPAGNAGEPKAAVGNGRRNSRSHAANHRTLRLCPLAERGARPARLNEAISGRADEDVADIDASEQARER